MQNHVSRTEISNYTASKACLARSTNGWAARAGSALARACSLALARRPPFSPAVLATVRTMRLNGIKCCCQRCQSFLPGRRFAHYTISVPKTTPSPSCLNRNGSNVAPTASRRIHRGMNMRPPGRAGRGAGDAGRRA
jgi:hypothetical protein